jgi:hypothetical protein
MRTFIIGAVALIAGCATVARLETAARAAGQLFCAEATSNGPLVVALVDLTGVPVIVTNAASAAVAGACAAWMPAAVPVSPPTGAVPTVAVNVKLVPAT